MKVRLFVALDLPAEVREALPAPGAGWRRLPPESLHVTLAFLGWTESEAVGRVCAVVEGALRPVGALTLERALLLPPRRPRVMAVALAGELGGLQASVSDALAAAGLYEPEARPFLAHVTIGRAKGPASRVLPDVPPLTFRAPSATVYRSHMSPAGARYEALCRFGL